MDVKQPDQITTKKFLPRARILWWCRAAVTLGLAAYLVWRMQDQLGELQLHLVQPSRLGLAALVAIMGVLLSVQLWSIFIPRTHFVSFRQLLAHYLIGMLWNNFLPGGVGGDATRAIALRQTTGRTDIAISTVLMTRLAGLWSIVLMASGAGVYHAVVQGNSLSVQLLLLSVGALVITAGGTIFLFGAPMEALMRHLPQQWASWHARLRDYRTSSAQLLESLGYSLAIQACAISINLLTAQALGLPIAAWQLWLSLPLITLVTLLPISIGGFGVREGSYVFLLGILGVSAADALVLSLAVYVLLTLVTAAGAGVSPLLYSAPDTILQQEKEIDASFQLDQSSPNLEVTERYAEATIQATINHENSDL